MAFLVPIAILLLLGVAEMSQIAYAAIEVSSAAKAGAQYGAQNRSTAADSTGIQNAATNDGYLLSGLTTNSSTACTCTNSSYSPSNCSDNTTCSSHGAQIEETLTVTTSVSLSGLVHGVGIPSSITLHGKAVQRVLN